MGHDNPRATKPDEETYRDPNPEELRSTNPKTPYVHERAVRVTCPTGKVDDEATTIQFEDGKDLYNVTRVLIAIEIDTPCRIFITRFNNEIGRIVYETADCLIGSKGEEDGTITNAEAPLQAR